jgi:hypothetical protein
MKTGFYALLACALLAPSPALSETAFAPNDIGYIKIILPEAPDAVEGFAASELVSYLLRVTGKSVCMGCRAQHVITLERCGQPASEKGDSLKEDGFRIRSVGANLVIHGKGSRGILYGAYAYLEKLGVRWFFPGPDHEIVPRRDIDWFSTINASESPAFKTRVIFYMSMNFDSDRNWIDFAAKARLNRFAFHSVDSDPNWYFAHRGELVAECLKRGIEIEIGGHFQSMFLPRSLYKEHPDWFRMDATGKRIADQNFNPFSPDALAYLVRGAAEFFSKAPEAKMYHAWADDIEGGGWSKEPGREAYAASDQALIAANAMLAGINAKVPGANLAFLAYHDTVAPPRIVKPSPGIILLYAPRERCYAHALDDSRCALNRGYRKALKSSVPVFGPGNAEVFEYYTDEILFENLAPAMPSVIASDIMYYRSLGISAAGSLAVNSAEFITPNPNMYLYPKALWNPRTNLQKELDEYAARYFGSNRMRTYFRELSEGLAKVVAICDYSRPGIAWDYLHALENEKDATMDLRLANIEFALQGPLARALKEINAAERETALPELKKRLAKEKILLEFTILQTRLRHSMFLGERYWRQHLKGDKTAAGRLRAEYATSRKLESEIKDFARQAPFRGGVTMPNPVIMEYRVRSLPQ